MFAIFAVMALADPVTLVSIAFLMLAASIAACIIPAQRAAELDPLIALRYE
jgi:ABC-type lipoprotein release transport system permease subunit